MTRASPAYCAECNRKCYYNFTSKDKISLSETGHIIARRLPDGQMEMVGDQYVIDYVLCQSCWKKRERTGEPML